MVRVTGSLTMQARVRAVAVLSHVLATGPGAGEDPGALSRRDVDRFLLRLRSLPSPVTGEALSANSAFSIAKGCGLVVCEATEMGFFPGLSPTFFFRRGDARWRVVEEEEARAIPSHVIAQLDAQMDLLRRGQSISGGARSRPMGVLGDQAGEVAVLAYRLLKSTGRRLGEIAGLHLDCLDVDEAGKAVLVYDNHKAARMAARLPLADSELVEAIRAQQSWVSGRFPEAERERLWLLPRATKNADDSGHISANQLSNWIRAWVDAIPAIDALPTDGGAWRGRAVRPGRDYSPRLPPHLRPDPGQRGRRGLGAARPGGPPQPGHHPGLLPGEREKEAPGHGAGGPTHRRQPGHDPPRRGTAVAGRRAA